MPNNKLHYIRLYSVQTKMVFNFQLLELLPIFTKLLIHPYSAVRHIAARCLAASVELDSVTTMTNVINDILPLLDAADCDVKRKGAIEAVVCIVDKLQFNIVCYIALLIIPLLGRIIIHFVLLSFG